MRRLCRTAAVLVSVVATAAGLTACGGSSTPTASKSPASSSATPASSPSPSAPASSASQPPATCDNPTDAQRAALPTPAPSSTPRPEDYDKLLTLLLTLCTAPATAQNVPVVTGPLGKAPVIAKPVGEPPKKLIIKDLVVGKGAAATVGGKGTFQYTGITWATGTRFDSSWANGKPYTAALDNNVIAGWQIGLPRMKVGGRRIIVVPPDLAYASQQGSQLQSETLVFVVDLIDVPK